MPRRRLAGLGAPVDGLETHYLYETPNTFPVDPLSLTLQPRGYLACPVKRRGHVLAVNQLHKSEILLRYSNWLVVQA